MPHAPSRDPPPACFARPEPPACLPEGTRLRSPRFEGGAACEPLPPHRATHADGLREFFEKTSLNVFTAPGKEEEKKARKAGGGHSNINMKYRI